MGVCLTAAFFPVEIFEDIVRDCLTACARLAAGCAVASSQPPNPWLMGAASECPNPWSIAAASACRFSSAGRGAYRIRYVL